MMIGRFILRRRMVLELAPVMFLAVGCAPATPGISSQRLILHQAMLDFTGLLPTRAEPDLKVFDSPPASWDRLPLERVGPIVHQQWRSPSHGTGVGIAAIRLPWPVSAKFLVWVAKMEYGRQTTRDGTPRGKLLAEWTDAEGREWFDAENDRFHVQGYAVTSGFQAWVIYTGYRLRDGCNWPELATATRSMQTVLPMSLARGGDND